MKVVPMLIGKDVDQAKSEILAAGFKVGNISYEENAQYPKNAVTSQQYIAGTELEEGSSIDIIVSKGMPQNVGSDEEGDSGSDDEGGAASNDEE